MRNLILLSTLLALGACDVSHILVTTTTPPPPPRPYAFGYAAGRFPGHIDRTHSEVSDGSGTVQGSYSYVDPSHKIRTVEYTADKQGFHPVLNYSPEPLPRESDAVAAARERHLRQFESIARKHQVGYVAAPRDSDAVAHAKEAHLNRYAAIAEAHRVVPGQVIVPLDTPTVQRATARHHDLFARIAEEHARIAAERKTEEEEVVEPNYL